MKDQWAAENLQVIRTLMERSAMYRRALAPVMTMTGGIGTVAALAGWKAGLQGAGEFVLYWLAVAVIALIAGMLLIRRQALQQGEVFWSPPTRRVSRAMMPPLAAGLVLGLVVMLGLPGLGGGGSSPAYVSNVGLPLAWVILHGCAVHAAGFYMQRGVRLLGWILLASGCLAFLAGKPATPQGMADLGYLIMGGCFGLLHLLYGIYLFATEKRPREA